MALITSKELTPTKRWPSGDHLVQDHTEAEDTRASIYLLPRACSGDIYWVFAMTAPASMVKLHQCCSVRVGRISLQFPIALQEAKSRDLDDSVLPQTSTIFRLDIAVNDSCAIAAAEVQRQSNRDVRCLPDARVLPLMWLCVRCGRR